MYREFFLSSRCAIPWNCRSEKREGLPGGTTPRSIQIYSARRMCANVHRCPALFSENADYVPLLLAPFGTIASL